MFGFSAPVHLEINKLLLEIPFVSQSWAQKDPARCKYSWSAFSTVIMLEMMVSGS